jgi:hypothetical protein
MNRPGPARRWPLVERHRQRSQQTLLAGLIRQPSAGVVATMQLDGFETIELGTRAASWLRLGMARTSETAKRLARSK